MGDENTVLGDAEARHLLRRATFGAPRALLDQLGLVGLTRGAAADVLLAMPRKPFAPGGPYLERAQTRWIKYLLLGRSPVQDKLVLFWHDHFSVAFSKVQDLVLMKLYVKLLYNHALGHFGDFCKAMNKNVAMMEFLDTVRNFKEIPNENYARELCELFTLGVLDSSGAPNYAQADVVQIARAFTGWNRSGRNPAFLEGLHDFAAEFPERGPKVLFPGAHGFPQSGADFAAGGEGAGEIDRVIDILLAHRDSDGRSTVARRIARRLLEYYAHSEPDLAVIDEVVDVSGFASSWDIASLVRAIWTHDVVYETGVADPFDASTPKSVKWPVDFVVGTLRALGMKLSGTSQVVSGGGYTAGAEHVARMGQSLLDPPSVFGWDWETEWFSTSTLLARYEFARDVGAARYGGRRLFVEHLVDLDETDPVAIVEKVLDVLDCAHHTSDAAKNVLVRYLTDEGANPTIDLRDDYFQQVKLRGLFTLVIQSPVFQFH